ncbi:MAG: GFA family protein, partial [Pseudomonadota bacterium]
GSGFTPVLSIPAGNFKVIKGQSVVGEYWASKHKRRCFCKHCGSALYSLKEPGAELRLRVGTLDEPLAFDVLGHIFFAERVDWTPVVDDFPKHAGFEPGRGR